MNEKFWGIVPAAGVGKRMGGVVPKQYLKIAAKPVLQHTLERLLSVESFEAIVVALSAEDGYWSDLPLSSSPRIIRALGGKERSDSVLSALQCLEGLARANDWVLVHDAARACITASDIMKLIDCLKDDTVGGILALPSSDTLKGVHSGLIVDTVDRNHVWRALTPQMFRYQALIEALTDAKKQGLVLTDEASALEFKGEKPKVLEGRPDNIKITRPEDIILAEFYLERQCYE